MGKSLYGQLPTKMQKWQNAKSKKKTTSYDNVNEADNSLNSTIQNNSTKPTNLELFLPSNSETGPESEF
jgi:hypothetical protein